MTEAAHKSAARGLRVVPILISVAAFVGNIIPLYGILYWGWDTFQLLMLYWMETAIIAFFTLLRIARLAPNAPQARSRASSTRYGEITINGRPQKASQFALVGFFALHAGAFILVHLLFLWLFFSREWLKKVHGVGSFFYELFVANYVWAALLFLIIASGVALLIESTQRLPPPASAPTEKPADPVGTIVGSLYLRIVIMQVAIIFGAMISGLSGSLAPLVIVIALKTLIDLLPRRYLPVFQQTGFSSGGKKLKIDRSGLTRSEKNKK